LHHAAPDHASGFCVFNDAAIAIRWLQGRYQRIFYLDVDVHHGDGVQAGFYEDPTVFTCSIHQQPRTLFPGTGFIQERGSGAGEGFCANLPLPPGCDGENYRRAFTSVVLPLIEKFKPEILVTQLGVDTHFRDPLAQLNLTTEDHEWIFKEIADLDLPWLALGGGGYAIDVVPRSWSLAVAAMTGRTLPAQLPPGYRQRYQVRWLRDSDRGDFPPRTDERLAKVVAQTISLCRRSYELDK
jgi:acetoin utilization protein AcuC